jgi:endonuclease/exonuclease/phosphatase family metal-dependent hydrolase
VTAVEQVPLEIEDPGDTEHTLLARRPVGVKFETAPGKTDVVVVVVHLKCCNAAGHRAAEAKALIDALEPLRAATGDRDILLIGDSNISRHDEPAVGVLGDAGFRDLNESDQSTYVSGGALDRAFVPPGENGRPTQPEFANSRFTVVRRGPVPQQEYRRRLSDHYLVYTDVRLTNDDD